MFHFSGKKLSSEAKTREETARKRDVPLFLTVKCTDGSGIYSKDWMNCTILTAVMANSRTLFHFSGKKLSSEAKTREETARKRDVPLFLTVKCTDGSGIYSKDWMNCTILTAVMANSRPLFIFSPARSSACCSLLTVSTPLITGTLPVALSRTSPSVVPRQM